MKRVLSITRRTASSTSLRMAAYWALRSSSGTVIWAFVGIALIGVLSWRLDALRVDPALVLEPLFDRRLTPWLRGSAEHHRARRDVARHHRPRCDQAVLADRHARQDHRAGADAGALA